MRRGGTVSVVLVRPLASLFRDDPLALSRFLAATDLTPELLASDDARLTPAQFCVAWSEAARLTGDTHVALRIAAATPPGSFGVVEYVCRSAPNLGEALRQWCRYLNLLDDAVEVGLVEHDDSASIRVLSESEAPAPGSHELCFALLLGQARQLVVTPFRGRAIEFSHAAANGPAVFRRALDVPTRFGAEHTQLIFPLEAMRIPLKSADPTLLGILQRHADAIQGSPTRAPPMTESVARALHRSLREAEGTVEAVASSLGMTPRSLQRRLRDEGTTFAEVREGVRQKLASRYLTDNLSNAEISFLLGFSEPSAFFRAFKRWTGLTPEESRARLQVAPVAAGS